jgi:hypothetical protein
VAVAAEEERSSRTVFDYIRIVSCAAGNRFTRANWAEAARALLTIIELLAELSFAEGIAAESTDLLEGRQKR